MNSVRPVLKNLPAYCALSLLCVHSAWAQSDPAASTSTGDSTKNPSSIIEPFKIDRSERMTVPVRINAGEEVPFIVDTGSERTVIASDLARYLSLTAGRDLTLATVTGKVIVGSYLLEHLTTKTIDMGDVEAPGLERNNIGAYGLLGIDSLEDHKVLLDFKKQTMEVLAARSRGSSLENGMIVVRASRRAGRMILSSANIDGIKVDIILDTGAQSSMGNQALRDHLRPRDILAEFATVNLHSVTGASLMGDYSQIRRITIGDLNIEALPITFTNNYIFGVLGLNERPAILLGMDALKLFDRVLIDFAHRKVGFDITSLQN